MFVSVILPIRNEAPFIEQVLRAVLNQDYPHDLMEVIVADGMSDDGTREIAGELADQDSRLRLLDNPMRITPAGLNLAIRAARGAVIVRVDGHGVLPPNYVRECVAFLTGTKRTEDRGQRTEDGGQRTEDGGQRTEGGGQRAEVGALLAVGGAWDSVGRGHVGEAIAIAMSSRFGVGNSPYRTFDSRKGPIQTDTVPYWAVKREVFERIGLFREEMLCHEDYEFNYRLRSAGGTILLLPWLRAKYYVRSTLGGVAQQYWRYGIWKGRFLCSHPESLKARHLIPPLFVTALAAGALASFLGTAGRFCLGSLVALYVGFLLAATVSLACSRSRRRETAEAETSAGRATMTPSRRSQSPADIRSPPSQGCIKLWVGPRAVPARSAQKHVELPERPERPGAVEAAASRDGSRSGGLGAALSTTQLSAFQLFSFSALRISLFLPLVLATLHLCWGAGVWVGLVRGKVDGQPPRLAA
jgi:succinoglycan biosynthesis protein ExoA